ncbi:MAG: trypsin-like peptidase domain-containing protein [Pseudomonadota bacterium]
MLDEAHILGGLDVLCGALPATPRARSRRSQAPPSAPLTPHPGARLQGVGLQPVKVLQFHRRWMRSRGVVAMGVAERITAGRKLRELAFKVYVQRKLPLAEVSVPIPRELELEGLPNLPVDIEQIGRIKLQSNSARVRPAIPGYSVGRRGDPAGTGTFGLVVRKRGTAGPLYLLSNSHVLAGSGMAAVGEAILQPGEADGGLLVRDTIGVLAEWVPFQFTADTFPNTVDVAIARLADAAASAAIAQLGLPVGVNKEVVRGMVVQKVGRTTTLSVAQVKDVHLRFASSYPTGWGPLRAGMQDQVLTTFYSAAGDSGAPVLDLERRVVGIHMAGSDMVGVFNKIDNVLAALDLEVVTQDGAP